MATKKKRAKPRRPAARRPQRRRKRSTSLFALPVTVVLVAAVVVVVVLLTRSPTVLGPGSGTVTVDWKTPGGAALHLPSAFSGTVEGLRLSGTAKPATSSATATPRAGTPDQPSDFPEGTWRGTLGTTPFTLEVFEVFGSAGTSPTNSYSPSYSYKATGTFGSKPVTAVASIESNGTLQVTGSAGALDITGTIGSPSEKGGSGHVRVSFDVTG